MGGEFGYLVPSFFLSFSPLIWLIAFYVLTELGSMVNVALPGLLIFIILLWLAETIAFVFFLKTEDGKTLNGGKAFGLAIKWILAFLCPIFFLPFLPKRNR